MDSTDTELNIGDKVILENKLNLGQTGIIMYMGPVNNFKKIEYNLLIKN